MVSCGPGPPPGHAGPPEATQMMPQVCCAWWVIWQTTPQVWMPPQSDGPPQVIKWQVWPQVWTPPQ